MKEKLKEAILSDNLYDFIARNGYEMEKSDLIELIKHLDFTVYELYKNRISMENKDDFNQEFISNLNDYDFFEEE